MIGAYAPLHTHAKTMTYRCEVAVKNWEKFFSKEPDLAFLERYGKTDFMIEPNNEESMIRMQQKIQNGEGPFYLSAGDVALKGLRDPLHVYRLKQG